MIKEARGWRRESCTHTFQKRPRSPDLRRSECATSIAAVHFVTVHSAPQRDCLAKQRMQRKRRSDVGKKHKKQEADLSELCKNYMDAEHPWAAATATANGVRLAGKAAAGKRMKASGVSPGVPDWLFFDSGPDGTAGLAIELKIDHPSKRNRLQPEQEVWFNKLRECKWRCVRARHRTRCPLTILPRCSPCQVRDCIYAQPVQDHRRLASTWSL